jgi:hypothetical protein
MSYEQVQRVRTPSKHPDVAAAEHVLPRRDAITLLQYLRDHRVTGTQSTGNLPLQAIREINTQLVPPMELDMRIGDKVFPLRSEEEVWRIYFPHILADVAGLLDGGRARRIRLTPAGERFLASDAEYQVRVLFKIWWYRVNWMIAYPYVGLGTALPYRFSSRVLSHLKRLPVDERVPFEEFADQVIETTGLTWTSTDPTYHRIALHGAVERMVIGILADFGAVKEHYRSKRIGKGTFKGLAAFRITSFGRALLDSLD